MIRDRIGRVRLGAVAVLGVGVLGLGVASASAAPTNAPNSLTGIFYDCTPTGDSGTFVINSGNSHAAQTWNVAHQTFSAGGTGIFVPTSLALVFNGVPETPVNKGATRGSVTCSIYANEDGFILSGSVTGKIVHNG
jgi:hypothetical protein